MPKRDKRTKKCEVCNTDYRPAFTQFYRQKYCSLQCKEKRRATVERERGIYKGGYSRETHIRLWMDALGRADSSAPCHYCQEPLYPDNFVIEHKKPRRELKSRDQMTDIANLVISCHGCNKEKGTSSYEEFKCLKS